MSNMLNNLDKVQIKGKNLPELQEWCLDVGYPKYRAKQIFEWMYLHGQTNPKLMTSLSKNIINDLDLYCSFQTLEIEKITSSNSEKTKKLLFRTIDNHFIEAVSMVDKTRHTVCLSSQIGCNVDCDFCATGKMGIRRNLNTGEIIDQLNYIRENIKTPITNIVFMGMGEPFLNYRRVLKAADIFNNPKGYGFAAHRITISTAGVLPKINKFYKEKRKYKLAISLNASNDLTRSKIMPINNKWSILSLVEIGKKHASRNSKVMFEYVLLAGINDSIEDAEQLSRILKGVDCKINIIPYNEIDGLYKRPNNQVIEEFLKILYINQDRYRIMVRWSKGQDINAGCGQLAINEADDE